ncbi:M16 family metallopeptidase [Vallitalea sp.]|jgi:predicted Zn-dependent peptidase|uniref:M16 family metallopeptidase n=1 Tax=Vallitalea sp. TaxID=1882829 RepID=UPI0025E23F80|nr:pitrilysin family protein [Vallitalea sp.]MCT4687428.1 insulinase family protein [Vallitalea sp.]
MVKMKTMDNGLCVVGEENSFVRSVALGIWIKNGSIDENKNNNGISHFIEHMMFKGTKNRTAKDIADEMSEVGGRINAFTGKEYMCYYAHTLDNHIDVALDVLSDMILNSGMKDEDMKKEKGVIIEEINMYEDSPEEIVHDLIQEESWSGSTLGYNILGTKELVNNFTKKDIEEYMSKHYIPENIVISVVGKFDFDEMFEKISKKFSVLKKKNRVERVKKLNYKKCFVTKDKDIEQIHLCMSFPSIPYNSDKIYILSILNTILGGGINSRLFQSIREEKGLAYSIYSYVETYNIAGMINIYAATNPTQIEPVILGVMEEINLLLEKGIDEKQLNQTKEQLKSNLIIGFENMNSRMSSYGKTKLMIDRIKSQDEMIEGINAVNLNSFMNFAKKTFNYNDMSTALVGRHKDIDIERIKNLCTR